MTSIATCHKSRAAGMALMLVAALAVSGCSDFRKAIGEEKSSPDEFEVVVRPPLSLPPGFKASSSELTQAAVPAVASAQGATDARAVAARALGSGEGAIQGGYETLFDFASVPDNIRETVDEETFGIQFERRLPLQMLFGGMPDIGPVLDQFAEDQRLRQNLREGRFPTDGGTPAIDVQTDEPLTIGE
jgi:hypothetical protein